MEPTRLRVELGPQSYDILLGAGTLKHLPSVLEDACPADSYALITDANVGGLYAEKVASAVRAYGRCHVFQFPAGEEHKNRETWARLTDEMLEAGLGRDSAVIALGGGVTGDLAGFVAATFMRGVPHVQVPTSLLAMIDSSVGGKTAVDTRYGKNLVGAFHQPRAVVADVAFLESLPSHHFGAGMAEAIKHGAIADANYFEALRSTGPEGLQRDVLKLTRAIGTSVEIKSQVVARDALEAGERAILNAGHTVAHALEAATGFGLLHGQALSIGLVAEAKLGEALGVTAPGTADRLSDALLRYDLPVDMPAGVTPESVAQAARTDKKNRGGGLRFCFLENIGRMHRTKPGNWTETVSEMDLINSLRGGP